MIFAALIFLAGALYGVSAYFGAGGAAGKSLKTALAGFAAHTAALVWFVAHYGKFPTSTPYGLLEIIVWTFVLIQTGAALFGLKFTGVFSMLPACVLALLPLGCPAFVKSVGGGGEATAAVGMHAILALVSYAFVAAAACFGILYILQRRSLRDKSRGIFSRLLPSLETLDRLGAMSVGGSVFSMLISVALGFYALSGVPAAEGASAAALWKFAAAAVLFCAQLAAFLLCAFGKANGIRLARIEILLAAIALAAMVPVEIFNISK